MEAIADAEPLRIAYPLTGTQGFEAVFEARQAIDEAVVKAVGSYPMEVSSRSLTGFACGCAISGSVIIVAAVSHGCVRVAPELDATILSVKCTLLPCCTHS